MDKKTLAQIAWEAMDTAWSLPAEQSWQAVADAVVAEYEARRWKPIESAQKDKYLFLFNREYFQGYGGYEYGRWRPRGNSNGGFTLFCELPDVPESARMTSEEREEFKRLRSSLPAPPKEADDAA